jgi:hypothetical protein
MCGRWLTAGERRVVVFRRHAQHVRADRRPGVGRLLDQLGGGLGQRRQDHLAALVERGVGVADAGHFLAGDRMRRHERDDAVLQHAAGGVDDVALGRADVHHQHRGLDEVPDRLEGRLGRRDGDGEQDDVRARDGEQRRFRSGVDDAEALRLLGRRWRFAVADDTANHAGPLERESERAAHQAATDHAELFEHPMFF